MSDKLEMNPEQSWSGKQEISELGTVRRGKSRWLRVTIRGTPLHTGFQSACCVATPKAWCFCWNYFSWRRENK